MDNLLLLLQFFTRIPVNKSFDYSEDSFKKASYFVSFTGIIIGLLTAFFIYLLFIIGVRNIEIISAFTLVFYVFINGAFHLDGLSDTCDGIFSGRSKERILEIMKDSRIGSYGTIAMFFSLLFKFFIFRALITISFDNREHLLLFILIPLSGKFALFIAGYKGKRAKEISSGNYFINNSSSKQLIANILTMIFSIILIEYYLTKILYLSLAFTIVSTFIIIIFTFLLRWFIYGKIDGLLGDNLGFIAELNEILMGIIFILIFNL